MKGLCFLLIHLFASLAKMCRAGGAKSIVAENLLLKQQLLVISRARQRAPNLRPGDRLLFALLTLFLRPHRIARAAIVIRPSTLLRFHQALVRKKYRELFTPRSHRKPGPKGPSAEVIEAIVELKRRNPSFGCPRIAFIINRLFGIGVNKDVVRRILEKHYPPAPGDGPSWLTFLGHMKDSLWSVDLFRCESILLRSHWVMVVMDQFTRRIVGFAVQAGEVDDRTLCRMFNGIIAGQAPPRYLSHDHSPLFGYRQWEANLRILEVTEVRSVPYVSLSHPFIERLIGTVRREFLDHVLFWNAVDLERKLTEFKLYYNEARVHSALRGCPPSEIAGLAPPPAVASDQYRWGPFCRGLVELPVAA